MQNEVDSNKSMPLITIPPPTQQPTDAELLLSLMHLICLTSTLCGNISQIVLQLYTHRIRKGTHVQQFLALFFLCNALVSLGTPWKIVETLIHHWTFGRSACKVYQATSQIGRTILPYLIVSLYVITLQSVSVHPGMKCKIRQTISAFMFIIIFILLFLFIIFPVIGSATLKSYIHGDPMTGDVFRVVFETYMCQVPFTINIYTKGVGFLVEIALPAITCLIFAIRLKIVTKQISDVYSVEGVNTCLATIAIINFSLCFWYYLSEETKEYLLFFIPKSIDTRDFINILPSIASSISWIPAANFSSIWVLFEIRSESPELSRNRNSCRSVRLLVPKSNVDVEYQSRIITSNVFSDNSGPLNEFAQ